MSDRYDDLREAGFDHRGAVRELASEVGFDVDTTRRVLARAGRSTAHVRSVSAPPFGPRGSRFDKPPVAHLAVAAGGYHRQKETR